MFMIIAFCRIDDTLKAILYGKRLPQRGPTPALSDSEVPILEVVGEYLEFTQDLALNGISAVTAPTCFQPWLGCTAALSSVSRLIYGWLGNWSDSHSWIPRSTTPLLPWWTASLCSASGGSVRPSLPVPQVQRGGGFWLGHPGPSVYAF